MSRTLPILFLVLATISASSQVRLSRLEIRPGEVYVLSKSDILVVDTLIMHKNSRLEFDHTHQTIFIHAGVAIFHEMATIDGRGVSGIQGTDGRAGTTVNTPCTNGTIGRVGSAGTHGGHGLNISFYFSDIKLFGKIVIDLSGGDAGNGGQGGTGGSGGPGTRICKGGDGGQGADGSPGGNGGNGGTLTFVAPRIPELRSMIQESIIVKNYGGHPGLGGGPGFGGSAGLSPVGNNRYDGKPGRKGKRGLDGKAGNEGAILFQNK